MPVYDVSSLFIDTAESKAPTVKREFTIAGSDYSEFVTKWPVISREWNEIKPKSITIPLANEEGTFNFFNSNPLNLTNSCEINFGFSYTPSSSETITVFSGKVGKVSYSDTKCSVTLIDKMKTFSERVVGTRDLPVDYTTSNYLPSDIAWQLATTYGGLSSVQSSSNPDIDYPAFLAWAEVFSFDTITMKALFDGQKVVECLRKIGRLTDSSIIEENGKIRFARFELSSSSPYAIPEQAINKVSADITDSKIINKQIVNADYDTTSASFGIVVSDVATPSVNSYGTHEQVAEDKNVWYVDSVSASNFAQRKTNVYSEPFSQYKIDSGVQPIARAIGDTVGVTYTFLGLGGDTYRVMGYKLDLDKCSIQLSVDGSQILTFFRLDVDTYSALDESYNPLG